MPLNAQESQIVGKFLRMGIAMADASLNDAVRADNSALMLKAANDKNALKKALEELEMVDLTPIHVTRFQPDVTYDS